MKPNKIALKLIRNTALDNGMTVREFTSTTEVTVKSKTGLLHTFVIRLLGETSVMIGSKTLVVNTIKDLESIIKSSLKEFKTMA